MTLRFTRPTLLLLAWGAAMVIFFWEWNEILLLRGMSPISIYLVEPEKAIRRSRDQ
jgi:hypothetical protein